MSKRSGLRLHRETVRELQGADMATVAGGVSITCFAGCPPTGICIIITRILLNAVESDLKHCSLAAC